MTDEIERIRTKYGPGKKGVIGNGEDVRTLLAEIDRLRDKVFGIEEYRRKNPLGGPAVIFDAIGDRLRAGESFDNVMSDYGITFDKAASQPEPAAPAEPETVECTTCGAIVVRVPGKYDAPQSSNYEHDQMLKIGDELADELGKIREERDALQAQVDTARNDGLEDAVRICDEWANHYKRLVVRRVFDIPSPWSAIEEAKKEIQGLMVRK